MTQLAFRYNMKTASGDGDERETAGRESTRHLWQQSEVTGLGKLLQMGLVRDGCLRRPHFSEP